MRKGVIFFACAFISTFTLSACCAEEEGRETIEIDEQIVEEKIPSYSLSLKRLVREAERNLKKIEEELKNQENERLAREYFKKGNALYKEGDLQEARKEWQEALHITKDPSMRKEIRENLKKARKEPR